MARAIAIETSGSIGAIALADNDTIFAETLFSHGLQHTAKIIPMMHDALQQRRWTPGDIEHVYVSAGPGSFTGLRVAITLAKTLAFAVNCKIIAIESTRVLAENADPQSEEVLIVLDARRVHIFTARYVRHASGWHEVEPPHLDVFSSAVARAGRPLELIGDGVPCHVDTTILDKNIVYNTTRNRASAVAVARLGIERARSGQFADPHTLTPIYLRLAEAEERRLIAAGQIAPLPAGSTFKPGVGQP
jgi:tRNA threonylcarbamoyladenosine biosynthesis protein TsaB